MGNPPWYPPLPLSGSIYPAALVAPSDSFKNTGHFITPEKRKKIKNAIINKIRDSGYSRENIGKCKQDKIPVPYQNLQCNHVPTRSPLPVFDPFVILRLYLKTSMDPGNRFLGSLKVYKFGLWRTATITLFLLGS
jgi:hypothetical protein